MNENPRTERSAQNPPASRREPLSTSRYEMLVKIASGGMATVYVGRLRGAGGFWRLVAIKRAHPHLLENASFKKMLIEEARLASRIHHPNVVAVQDVEELEGELRLVMDYVQGASLAEILSAGISGEKPLPPRIALRIVLDACAGLHAAHELRDERGEPLDIVHRDVSPHNILVGVDGTSRLSDFGIAKHSRSGVSTTTGALKGKIAYMAPEYIEHGVLDARSDVFALGAVTWEAVANKRLFAGDSEFDTLMQVIACDVPKISSVADVGTKLDSVLAKALARSPEDRFRTAGAFGAVLDAAARESDLIASHAEVGDHVNALFGPALEKRREYINERVTALEEGDDDGGLPPISIGRPGRPATPTPDVVGRASAQKVREGRTSEPKVKESKPPKEATTIGGSVRPEQRPWLGSVTATTKRSILPPLRKPPLWHKVVTSASLVLLGGIAAFAAIRLMGDRDSAPPEATETPPANLAQSSPPAPTPAPTESSKAAPGERPPAEPGSVDPSAQPAVPPEAPSAEANVDAPDANAAPLSPTAGAGPNTGARPTTTARPRSSGTKPSGKPADSSETVAPNPYGGH